MAKCLVISMTKPMGEAIYTAEINELEDFYEHLECGCMDVANRKIGNKRFDIWVDDEGLLKDSPIISAVSITDGEVVPMLAGNLIIANHDLEGNTTSLSDEDIEMILEHVFTRVSVQDHGLTIYPYLECEY